MKIFVIDIENQNSIYKLGMLDDFRSGVRTDFTLVVTYNVNVLLSL